jgi:aerobic-type carbon monoxide dehydrogenase small subunit (CoxS/CutS family)
MNEVPRPHDKGGISRRGFLKTTGIGVAATSLLDDKLGATRIQEGPTTLKGDTKVAFKLNGAEKAVTCGTGVTLLELLRDQLDLTGTKMVCDRGSCGACTIQLDGKPVNSCLLLTVDVAGRDVQTIEGLAKGDVLHPLQQAFVDEDALQCGFCTPGMVMSCKALLDRNPAPTRDDVADACSIPSRSRSGCRPIRRRSRSRSPRGIRSRGSSANNARSSENRSRDWMRWRR